MKDKEIIKALECCSKPYCNDNKCPLHKNTVNTKDCITQLSTNALALINRQQAEIERLQQETKHTNDLRLEIFENKSAWERLARAEAIKEFVERLKKGKYISKDEKGKLHILIELDEFDNLVKEMVGDDK